ncbi:MAG: cysteine desulfurase [Acidobacteria bacterium]|nr:cysteine desulfurase [Acidobacteriota bacterium]
MTEVYLDYNASAPVRRRVREAVAEALEDRYGNPSSIHRPGHRAKVLLESARASVAALLGAHAEEVVFTSGGTESNNLALFGAAHSHASGHLIVTAVEHSSVLQPAGELERRGFRVTRVAPDHEGWVSPDAILAQVAGDTFLVSLMHSNHEVGTLQEVGAVAKGLRGRNILLHCDAVQSAGKVPLDVTSLGADLVSLSAHKLGAPAGVGALWIRRGVRLSPLLRGGSQETNRRAGTQALALIAGFGEAARLAREELPEEGGRLLHLRMRLEEDLLAAFRQVRIHGQSRPRLPGTCHLALHGLRGEDLVTALDLEGVAVSTGSACTAGTVRPSHVLQAMGCPPDEVEASLRVSLGYRTQPEDLVRFLETLRRIALRHVRAAAGGG